MAAYVQRASAPSLPSVPGQTSPSPPRLEPVPVRAKHPDTLGTHNAACMCPSRFLKCPSRPQCITPSRRCSSRTTFLRTSHLESRARVAYRSSSGSSSSLVAAASTFTRGPLEWAGRREGTIEPCVVVLRWLRRRPLTPRCAAASGSEHIGGSAASAERQQPLAASDSTARKC